MGATEATDLVASSRLRNYEITRLRADRFLFISGEGQITELHIMSLQRPLIGSQLKIEITGLGADRCLFISGEGQITELHITSLQRPLIGSQLKIEITRL